MAVLEGRMPAEDCTVRGPKDLCPALAGLCARGQGEPTPGRAADSYLTRGGSTLLTERRFSGSRRVAVAPLALRDFFAIHDYIARRLDADAHLRPVDGHDGDFHIVADAKGFTGSSS